MHHHHSKPQDAYLALEGLRLSYPRRKCLVSPHVSNFGNGNNGTWKMRMRLVFCMSCKLLRRFTYHGDS